MKLALFGSAERPLRCSRLPKLVRCQMSAVVDFLAEGEAFSPAADTGSAVHFAIQAWHTKPDERLAILTMRACIEKFPFADLEVAEQHFRGYIEDPRNQGLILCLCESNIVVELPPHPTDPTGAPVVYTGTLDQVRLTKYGMCLLDIKTGAPEGIDMLHTHCLQLAAYQYGASLKLGERVRHAGIIKTKDYLKKDRSGAPKPGPVFYEAPWAWSDLPVILSSLTLLVAQVRAHQLHISPGEEACKYCIGIPNCVAMVNDLCSPSQRYALPLLQSTPSS